MDIPEVLNLVVSRPPAPFFDPEARHVRKMFAQLGPAALPVQGHEKNSGDTELIDRVVNKKNQIIRTC
jgi:hypothetical protein